MNVREMHSEVDFVANLYCGVEKAMVPAGPTFSLWPLQLVFCKLFPFLVAGFFCVAVLLHSCWLAVGSWQRSLPSWWLSSAPPLFQVPELLRNRFQAEVN